MNALPLSTAFLVLPLVTACGPAGSDRHPGDDSGADSGDTAVAFALSPARAVLQPDETLQLDVAGAAIGDVAFASSDADVLTVDAGGLVTAVDYGVATVTASHDGEDARCEITVAEEETRAIWVTRWSYSDEGDVDEIMDDIAAMHANVVYFQVRGRFDAFYDSDLEPWARELSGTLGQDPGWDPLAYAVTAAHARGLELHAYLNLYPMWSGTTPPDSSGVPHPYEDHPDWVVYDDAGDPMPLNASYVFASPGNPAVRAHVVSVVADVASRYGVDGIHLDYVRYPGPDYSHDPASLNAWGGTGNFGDWQRQQITDTLLAARGQVDVPLSAAVWGIYENDWGWSAVSQGNIDYYQDSRAFLAQGALDATAPMIYWPVTATPGDRLDFRTLAADHVDHASGRHVYPGIDTELTWSQILACIQAARDVGAPGVVLFSYSGLTDQARIDGLASGPWADPAVPAPMSWRADR